MIMQHINSLVNDWKEEREMHLELKNYKETINNHKIEKEEEKFDLNFHDDYIKFIDGATASVEELRTKLANNKFDI